MKSGDGSITVADDLSFLGECLYLEGKNEEAESKLRQALTIFERHSPNLRSRVREYLARLPETKGEYLEAAWFLQEATEIDRRAEGADSPPTPCRCIT